MSPRVYLNGHATAQVPDVGFAQESRRPLATHASLPGYTPTQLHDCASLASRLGVARVLVKDESERLGLPSFKILGASWAVLTTVAQAWTPQLTQQLTVAAVRAAIGDPAGRRLVAATDGNHGRGVARMASLLGLDSTILVPAGTAPARIAAIESEGARVEVVDGTYDDAIAASAALAGPDALVISDTSWEGYEAPPRAVVEGYSTMFHEIDDALPAHGVSGLDVVAVQAGVGAFASAALRHYRSGTGVGAGTVPRTVVVEPSSANCLMVSAEQGALTAVPGPHRSTMAGLNCGLPSTLVWPVLEAGTDVFVAIDDEQTYDAMRALAAEGIVAGESGAAGLGGLLHLADHGSVEERHAAGLHPEAVVLVVNTEGATDPENYRAVVGDAAGRLVPEDAHGVTSTVAGGVR